MILFSLGDIKHAGAAWAVMPEEEKAKYRKRARTDSIGGGSEESKLLQRKRLLKQLKIQVGCNGQGVRHLFRWPHVLEFQCPHVPGL